MGLYCPFLLILSTVAAYGATVDCVNALSDANIVQSAVNGGGTVTINGTCNFAGGGVSVNNAVSITGTATFEGNSNNSGHAFNVNADNVSITNLTFNSGLGAVSYNGTIRSNEIFTGNTITNTYAADEPFTASGVLNNSTITNNKFQHIGGTAAVPIQSWTTNPCNIPTSSANVFGGCSVPAGKQSCWANQSCDAPWGVAFQIGGGLNNTVIEYNTFDYCAKDCMYLTMNYLGDDAIQAALGYPGKTIGNDSISYNTFTHFHRFAIESQGGFPNCGPGPQVRCDYGHVWGTNLNVKGNFAHHIWYSYGSFAFSYVPSYFDGEWINNTTLNEFDDFVFGQGGFAVETANHNWLMQGNVITGNNNPYGYPSQVAWGVGFGMGRNDNIGTGPGLYTGQNNVLCSDTVDWGNDGAGTDYKLIRYNYQNSNPTTSPNNCPGSPSFTPTIRAAFVNSVASGSNTQFNFSFSSTLSLRYVTFYIDGSSQVYATQELSDLSTTFASDMKWLYHATLNPASLSGGTHTLTATATDVSGETSSVTTSFTASGPKSTPTPVASLSPNADSFGSQTVNVPSASRTMTLTNTGTAALTIGSIAISGTNAADFKQSSTCSSSLAPNASCVISSVFTPSSAKFETANVVVTDNASGSPQIGTLSGTGVTTSTPPPAPTTVKFTIKDSAGLFWDAGNSQWGQNKLQIYPSYIPNSAQDWSWTTVTGGYVVCSLKICLSDNGSQVIMGAKADVITITSTSAVLDVTTGRYFVNPSSPTSGAVISTGSTASTWIFSSTLH